MSLEASTTPQSLIIVWPAISGPANVSYDEVTTYSVFINGQPFGEQVRLRSYDDMEQYL